MEKYKQSDAMFLGINDAGRLKSQIGLLYICSAILGLFGFIIVWGATIVGLILLIFSYLSYRFAKKLKTKHFEADK